MEGALGDGTGTSVWAYPLTVSTRSSVPSVAWLVVAVVRHDPWSLFALISVLRAGFLSVRILESLVLSRVKTGCPELKDDLMYYVV